MNRFLRDIAAFSASERRGVFVLLIILIILWVIGYYFPAHVISDKWNDPPDSVREFILSNFQKHSENENIKTFDPNTVSKKELKNMHLPTRIIRNILSYRKAGGVYHNINDLRKIYGMTDTLFEKLKDVVIIKEIKTKRNKKSYHNYKVRPLHKFNPQTFSFNKLINAGVNPKAAYGIVRYRDAGGVYTKKSDLKKVFAIKEKYYQKIKPYIEISKTDTLNKLIPLNIELNSASFSELKKIKISPFAIKRVINYRKRLGGYYDKHQLYEIFNLDSASISKILNNTFIDPLKIKKINIQKCTLRKLAEHPYLNYKKAKTIIRYRNFVKKIDNLLELVNSKVLKASDTLKLTHYLRF